MQGLLMIHSAKAATWYRSFYISATEVSIGYSNECIIEEHPQLDIIKLDEE